MLTYTIYIKLMLFLLVGDGFSAIFTCRRIIGVVYLHICIAFRMTLRRDSYRLQVSKYLLTLLIFNNYLSLMSIETAHPVTFIPGLVAFRIYLIYPSYVVAVDYIVAAAALLTYTIFIEVMLFLLVSDGLAAIFTYRCVVGLVYLCVCISCCMTLRLDSD